MWAVNLTVNSPVSRGALVIDRFLVTEITQQRAVPQDSGRFGHEYQRRVNEMLLRLDEVTLLSEPHGRRCARVYVSDLNTPSRDGELIVVATN